MCAEGVFTEHKEKQTNLARIDHHHHSQVQLQMGLDQGFAHNRCPEKGRKRYQEMTTSQTGKIKQWIGNRRTQHYAEKSHPMHLGGKKGCN